MRIALVIIGIFIFASCANNLGQEKYYVFHEETWIADSIITMSLNEVDTNSSYKIALKIRHSIDYEYQNLFLFVGFQNKIDTVEIMLSEKSGRWTGRGFGDIKEKTILLREEVFFSSEKQNRLIFEQAMRYGGSEKINELKGIIAIGVGVNKNDK